MSYDQYILANNNDYSGSYTDSVSVKTIVKTTNINNGVLLDQITHSWVDGVVRSPNVFYTFNNTLNDSSGNGYNLTLFTGSQGTSATYDSDDIKPGIKSYGFNNTILSASGLFKNVFNGNAKTFTIEFLMKPKSRTPETFIDTGIPGAPSSSWSGTGFTGVGSMYLEYSSSLKFNYDANSRGLFGIHSSGSSTYNPAFSDHSAFYPKSIFCYGHDLIGAGTNTSPSSLHGSRVAGVVYDNGDAKVVSASGIYLSSDGFSLASNVDFDSKRPQNYLLNEWQYVVITRDSNSYKTYINGDLMDEVYPGNVAGTSYAPDQSLTFGINPEVLWRVQAIQDINRSANSPTYAVPWYPNTNKGWPHILKNLTDSSQITTIFGEIPPVGPIYRGVSGDYPTGGPPSSSFIDTLCWTGSLSHWRLYQGVALDANSIKSAYEKIFVPTFNLETIPMGLKTTDIKEKNIYDSYGSAYKTTTITALSNIQKIKSRDVSIPKEFVNSYKDLMLSSIIDVLSGSSVGNNNNFNNFEDSDETFYDSLVASPIDYHLANGAQPILLESGSRTSNSGFSNLTYSKNTAFLLPIIGKGIPNSFASQTPTAGVQSNKIVSGSETLMVGDNMWAYFFPFETKYKTFSRLKKPSNVLSQQYTVKLGDSGSISVLPWTFNTKTGYVRSNSDGVLNSPVNTNIFSGMLLRLGGIDDPAGVSEADNIENANITCVSDFTLRDAYQFMQQGNLTGLVNASVFNKKMVMAPKLVDTYKTYFGVGRKFNIRYPGAGIGSLTDSPNADTVANMRVTGASNIDGGPGYTGMTGLSIFSGFKTQANFINSTFYGVGTKVDGWKYGLYSAIPTKNTAIFRRDRFGHFRDMLEQRIFTKFSLATKNTTTQSPVTIRFVKDSDAAVTSSLGLDNNSSGIYDFEYASGKPFIERDQY